jgi:hypothetical protein
MTLSLEPCGLYHGGGTWNAPVVALLPVAIPLAARSSRPIHRTVSRTAMPRLFAKATLLVALLLAFAPAPGNAQIVVKNEDVTLPIRNSGAL